MARVSVILAWFWCATAVGGVAHAQSNAPATAVTQAFDSSEIEEFGGYDIAELQRIKVTSVSRKPENITEAPAAIFVITHEDIRRSGAVSIPEALRMAPGLNVARIDAGRYAISSRGFNDRFSNKLLVLMDRRAIYTPAFGGVFWEKQDTLMEDIDRIEIIRGPGGSLWGANAFNGVINITTRPAAETQGWLFSGGAGDQENAFGAVRYGGAISDSVFYRAYAKALDRDDLGGIDHSSGHRSAQSGFRVDGMMANANAWTLQGDVYHARSGETVQIPNQVPPSFSQISNDEFQFTGGNILGRLSRRYKRDNEAVLQLYYDRSRAGFLVTGEAQLENTGDIDFEHRFRLAPRHEVVWGLGYRVVQDESEGSFSLSFEPNARTTQVLNVFAQDTVRLASGLSLVFGSKLEHNDYTGFEVQPNLRLAWLPVTNHTLWASVARAVRTPSRLENDVRVAVTTIPGPLVVRGLGSTDVDSESLVAYELGYRIQPRKSVSIDMAAFYKVYNDLTSREFGAPNTMVVPPELPFMNGSELHGTTYGGEAAAQIKLMNWWSLQPAFSLLRMHLATSRKSRDPTSVDLIEGSSPQHQFSLRSRMDFPHRWELDNGLRYVDALPGLTIPSYITLETRIGWRPLESLELSLVGQNLLKRSHPEFAPTIRAPRELPEVNRSLFGKFVWRL